MSVKISKRELNESLNHLRILLAADYDRKEKVKFIDLREEISDLITVETEKKERLFKEKREAVIESINKEVDKFAEEEYGKKNIEFKNKESYKNSIIQDDLTLAKIARERVDFWGTPVINNLPFIIIPGLKALDGQVSLVVGGDGETQKFSIKPSFDWLIEKGFICTEQTEKENETKAKTKTNSK